MVANDNHSSFDYKFWIKWVKIVGWAGFIGGVVWFVVERYT